MEITRDRHQPSLSEYMPPTSTLEVDFKDYKPALSGAEAITEANRCLNCFEAPCIRACPTEINIPQFIGRIGTGNTRGAAKTILDSNILGHSCANACPTEVLCEGACVYNQLNKKPILIGKLQRYAVEKAYEAGIQFYSPGPETGKKIALLGAGPASLACAHELRKYGHATVIYEKSQLPGGLNTFGIAPYKMKAAASLAEIEQIRQMGVGFKFEQELGKNLELENILETYDYVFLGLGLGPDTLPKIPGSEALQNCSRFCGATEFITQLKCAPRSQMEWLSEVKTAVVIGGGNTALDVCRELKALEIPNVIMSYRKGEAEMSGYAHELKAARQEGVEFRFHTLALKINLLDRGSRSQFGRPPETDSILDHPHLDQQTPPSPFLHPARSALHAQRAPLMQLELFFPDSPPLIAELVILATGQSKLEALLSKTPGLKFDRDRLLTDPKTGATQNPRIFAGGDLSNGGKEVVNAVAEGKRAAQAIHEQIRQEIRSKNG